MRVEDIVLEKGPCPRCYGIGKLTGNPYVDVPWDCDDCNGTGMERTEIGSHILDFIYRNIEHIGPRG